MGDGPNDGKIGDSRLAVVLVDGPVSCWVITHRSVRHERTMQLEPIEPETAVELYLSDRNSELAEATLAAHRSRLGHFNRWCDERGIDNLNELTGISY